MAIPTVAADAVRWRQPGARRPWIAGTAPDSMASLLDPAARASLLEAARHVGKAPCAPELVDSRDGTLRAC